MKITEIIEKLGLKVLNGAELTDADVSGCYIGDLLSLAMSRVQKGFAWITIQTNLNIVAVASLAEAGCIIIADGFVPEENVLQKAQMQDVIILGSDLSAYELAKGLSEIGI